MKPVKSNSQPVQAASDRLVTLAEVGERLNRCVRVVKSLLSEHPEIVPIKVGRSKMLTESDYSRLLEALRCPFPAGSMGGRARVVRSVAVSRSDESRLEEFLKAMKKPRPKEGTRRPPVRSKK